MSFFSSDGADDPEDVEPPTSCDTRDGPDVEPLTGEMDGDDAIIFAETGEGASPKAWYKVPEDILVDVEE